MTESDSQSKQPSFSGWDRRQWLAWLSLTPGLAWLAGCTKQRAAAPTIPTDVPFDHLLHFPGKVPMRAINDRPPCLETPWKYFQTDITPNDAFYVRWHLQQLPEPDLKTWKLKLHGHVDKPLEFSMDQLRQMEPISIVAVNQCSGNSRGLFVPAIPGAQWTNGAMGNAKWTGVRLRDLLQRAGIKSGAVDVTFTGMDKGGPATVPDYVKSIPLAQALRPEVLLAYDMNGAALPPLNGFPLRLVVPGWFATYWVKAISDIGVLDKPYDGYWVKTAYRIPKEGQTDKPGDLAKDTVPIHRMLVRSFFSSPQENSVVPVGQAAMLDGFAFDGGSGIKTVEVSTDGGKSWQPATLGDDLGVYSFRRWKLSWTPPKPDDYKLMVRATNNEGQTQSEQPGWSRAGYLRNVIESWRLKAV